MAKTAGRRKIKLKIIDNEKDRVVTLSKRHDGLFKKAGELATLCGAQIAIILFTISGKPLAFGSPNVVNVLKKFLGLESQSLLHGDSEPEAFKVSLNSFRKVKLKELNLIYNDFNAKSTTNKKHRQTLEDDLKVFLGGKTYEDYKSSMMLDTLMQVKYKLEQMDRDLNHGFDKESGSFAFKDEYEPDLSKIEGPKDYLKF